MKNKNETSQGVERQKILLLEELANKKEIVKKELKENDTNNTEEIETPTIDRMQDKLLETL